MYVPLLSVTFFHLSCSQILHFNFRIILKSEISYNPVARVIFFPVVFKFKPEKLGFFHAGTFHGCRVIAFCCVGQKSPFVLKEKAASSSNDLLYTVREISTESSKTAITKTWTYEVLNTHRHSLALPIHGTGLTHTIRVCHVEPIMLARCVFSACLLTPSLTLISIDN